jgi:hypothetical protein
MPPIQASGSRSRSVFDFVAPRVDKVGVSDQGSIAPAGWYDEPGSPGARRFWNGEVWADSWQHWNGEEWVWSDQRTTATTSRRVGSPRPNVWPAGIALVLGAVGLWFAQTYKPSVSNALGLNGNTFFLKPGAYHALVIVSIVLLIGGGIRLLMVLTDSDGGRRS